MGTHQYQLNIPMDYWNDLNNLTQLDHRSRASFILEGIRLVRDKTMMELSDQRKRRESLTAMTSQW